MENEAFLCCPLTRQSLRKVSLLEARQKIADGQPLSSRIHVGEHPPPVGETNVVFLREDLRAAYPITSTVPILLGPEILSRAGNVRAFDLKNSHYAECYSESDFYNQSALADAEVIRSSGSVAGIASESVQHLNGIARLAAPDRARFPDPLTRWLSGRMDLGSEADCFRFLAPLEGRSMLQVGGKGIAAVLFFWRRPKPRPCSPL